MTQQFHFQIFAHKTACTYVPRVMNKNIYSSIINNNPKLETTQMSINYGMDENIAVHSHNGLLYTIRMIKLLINSSPWVNLKDIMLLERSQTKKKKKRKILLYGSIYVKFKTRQN